MLNLSINGVQPIFSAHIFKRDSNYATTASKPSKIHNSTVDYLVNSLGFSKEEAFVTSSNSKFPKSTENPNSVVDYLVNSLGFSNEEAFVISSNSRFPKSTENPNSVIDFFKNNGFSQSQIKQLVSKAPRILSSNVDKSLKPKIQALLDLGFSKSDLAHVISLYPDICWRSLNDHIIPTFEILKSVFGDDNEVLINAVKKSPRLFGHGSINELPDIVSLLKSYGLSDHQIMSFVWQPFNLSLSIESLKAVLIRVENLGIPRESGMFFHGIYALCCISEATLDARKRIYKSYGFTDEDISTLVRKNPYALRISESKLRNSLDFFIKEAGQLPSQIATVPNVLNYSLETRVIPRYRVWKGLKEKAIQKVTKKKIKNINASFFTSLRITEPQFFEKFVQPYKDVYPDLYSDYVKVVRPALFEDCQVCNVSMPR